VPLEVQDLQLEPAQMDKLKADIRTQLRDALETHGKREEHLAELLRAYKVEPEHAVKNFPWPNASNVVVPIVPVSCDGIAARLQRSLLMAQDFCEVEILSPVWEPFKKDIRDWVQHYITTSGARDRLRTVFSILPRDGDAIVKPIWVEETRKYHIYNDAGVVVEQNIPGYVGVRWHVIPAADFICPSGFDSWDQLPWFAERLRYTWIEVRKAETAGMYKDTAKLKTFDKERDDVRGQVQDKAAHVDGKPPRIYDLYEVQGEFEIPQVSPDAPPVFEEIIVTYSVDADLILRAIYNPYFGKARHVVKIPFLVQPGELYSQGAAEMAKPHQEEASTAHNQVIDAATAANAGIIVRSPNCNLGPGEEVYPGKQVVTDEPGKDFLVVHLGEPSRALADTEQKAAFWAEKRTGISSYNMGLESSIVGSQATATGTTAIINEGNMRFWVSIDDMRNAITELLYLTIQQEQQMRPQGYEWAPGRMIKFPQGDVRTSIGLKLTLTSETINRDMEVQSMMLLMQVLNEYYARLMQATALIFNPQFPPQQKMMAVQIMQASQNIVKRFVERFHIENLDQVVPSIIQALMTIGGALNGQAGMAPGAPAGQGLPPGGPGGGPPQLSATAGPSGGGAPIPTAPGGGPILG